MMIYINSSAGYFLSNITSPFHNTTFFYRVLNGANLGGELGDKLWNFSSIITM